MNTVSTFRHWMHRMHDEGVKATHLSQHIVHERSFWGIMAIVAILALLFTLIVLHGEQLPIHDYGVPAPYGYSYI